MLKRKKSEFSRSFLRFSHILYNQLFYRYVTSIERFPVVICASILIATCALGVVAVMTKGIPSFGEPRAVCEQ